MVETAGIRQVMWFVVLESAKDRVIGVDTPRFSSVSQGCFTGTHTFGVCGQSSMRGQRPIIFTASVTWSRLPHQGGHSREA
jgi:hypothetical protein